MPVLLILPAIILALTLPPARPAAAAPPDHAVYLPHVQRNVPAHPQGELLRLAGARGFAGAGSEGGACGWDAGVLAQGWGAMWQRTGDEQYWLWLGAWLDGCIARGVQITHVNDIPLAYAAVVLHERQPRAEYLALAQAGAAYIFDAAPRTQDGTLIHLAGMVWDDTLIVVIPFLLEMGRYTGEARYLDEAVAQVQGHAAHLQDPLTGLYHHAWAEEGMRPAARGSQRNGGVVPAGLMPLRETRVAVDSYTGPSYWGRGNGWALWAQAALLAALPPSDARRPALAAAFRRQAAALVAVQAGDGRWHTVVTRSDFYPETSATALISAGLLLAAAHGLGGGSLPVAGQAGAAATWRQVRADGTVGGVSGPTGPMGDEEAYNAIAVEEFTLYGQGVVLLLGATDFFSNQP